MIKSLTLSSLALERGGRALFSNLDLCLKAGEALSLVGPNGAGKTTLLRAIAGFISPMKGEIRFLDAGTQPLPQETLGDLIHFVGFHEGLKGTRTAREELLFQAGWFGGNDASAMSAAKRLSLIPLLDLETRKLSAGQRRRLSLARLLSAPRPIWLMDEPLSPLDSERREQVGELMSEHLATGGLILAAVHDPLPVPSLSLNIRDFQEGF